MLRLISIVSQSGLPLIIRSVDAPGVALKARAMAIPDGEKFTGFKVGNISDRGMSHLMQFGTRPFMIEFILKSEKVQFQSNLEIINRQFCVFSLPSFIESLERRRNARYPVGDSLKAFLSFKRLETDPLDLASQPAFDSAWDMASMIPVSDISIGGVGVQFRFPVLKKIIDSAKPLESTTLWLPMMASSDVDVSIRWSRPVSESLVDEDGVSRVVKSVRLGIQFLNPSELQLNNIQIFIQRLSQADAI